MYQLPILLYHRIVNKYCSLGKHKIYVWEERFRKQMQFLKENGYTTITFSHLIQYPPLALPARTVMLTFDDGYEDNYTILFPILKEFGFTAVVYFVSRCPQNSWAVAEGEPSLKLLTRAMIEEMSRYGIEFGGHTCSHSDLTKLSTEKLYQEIIENKKDIEEITGKPVLSFAYPYGAYTPTVIEIVQQVGYQFAVTTRFGESDWTQDKMRIRRIEIRPSDSITRFGFKVSGFYFQKNYLQYLFS